MHICYVLWIRLFFLHFLGARPDCTKETYHRNTLLHVDDDGVETHRCILMFRWFCIFVPRRLFSEWIASLFFFWPTERASTFCWIRFFFHSAWMIINKMKFTIATKMQQSVRIQPENISSSALFMYRICVSILYSRLVVGQLKTRQVASSVFLISIVKDHITFLLFSRVPLVSSAALSWIGFCGTIGAVSLLHVHMYILSCRRSFARLWPCFALCRIRI